MPEEPDPRVARDATPVHLEHSKNPYGLAKALLVGEKTVLESLLKPLWEGGACNPFALVQSTHTCYTYF